MKALSIRQPWCWAILFAGKDVENRDWHPHRQNMRAALAYSIDGGSGQEIYLHASQGMTRREYDDFADLCCSTQIIAHMPRDISLPPFEDLPRGGIVGSFRISGIVAEYKSPWFFGPFGLVLHDAKPLPFRPCKGQLGFFEVPEE